MDKFIKIEDAEELMEESYEDGLIDAMDMIADLYLDSCDVVIDMLEENGLTLSEKLLVVHALELQSKILNTLIKDEFDIKEDEVDCDGNCAECELSTEE